jgi:hypothetical protein
MIAYNTLFGKIGKHVGRSLSYAPLASTTLPADLAAIIAQYGTGSTGTTDAQAPVQGLPSDYASFQNQIVAFQRKLSTYVGKTLTDFDTVVSQLAGLAGTDVTSVIKALVTDMADNSQSVKANAVTLGLVTPKPENIGNGTALIDATLDGFNVPVNGAFAHILYNALLSQLCVPSETMQLICTQDSFSGGQEGGEQWQWSGGQSYQTFDWHAEGSGVGGALTTANISHNPVSNLDWTSFSPANSPVGWTLAAGTAGVDFFQDTGNAYRAASSLKIAGTGATMPALTFPIAAGAMNGRRRYLFTTQAKIAGVVGAGNLEIVFSGTGYTPAAGEKIEQSLNGIGASYGLYSFYVNTPATIPSNFTLNIRVVGANLGAASNLWLSSGTFMPVSYFGGINAQVIAGSTPWAVGDRLVWTVQNTTTGKFQNYLRQYLRTQLPSKSDGSETISDAAAG